MRPACTSPNFRSRPSASSPPSAVDSFGATRVPDERLRLQRYSYRFAEQVLNSKLALKEEIEDVLSARIADFRTLSRPGFNKLLEERFVAKGCIKQPPVFDEPDDPGAKMDFLKDRIGIEVGFGHASFIGIDLLKFQVASYSALNKIDVGVYITTTTKFQKSMMSEYGQNWEGSLSYEKVCRYLPHFKSAIQLPIWVLGIEF
ncbi:MAG TPA: BglII/BstYI family type II restriction endonuclease [Candidatus Acidoferrales bacterium]|nr:BglII/BstYI family type II restriction endonuclease [Candidatus Acidoferrales bacterium]